MRTRIVMLAMCCLIGCGDPPPKTNKPNPPDANDPAFSINGLQGWYLVGDQVTAGQDQLAMVITPPGGVSFVDAYIGDLPVQRMEQQSDGFGLQTSIASLAPGVYTILFSADGADTAFAQVTFDRSLPYYVLVSTDYDFSDPGYSTTDIDMMHAKHPELRITHFWAPYTYTDPMVTEQRRDELSTWIQTQRDTFHDEIGLHIHPYCTFVADAGMQCITDQSTVYPAGDMSGYTIKVSAYGHDNFAILLQHAFDIFAARGLGKPQTFRAGGWTADLTTMHALDDKGFIADTSALNWARIEEWNGYELYNWTMQHWGPIDDTSQPYYPSNTDVLATQPGNDMSMLEVPDNGVMIDYVSTAEMTQIFNENWDGTPLTTTRTLMMGFHPSDTFSAFNNSKVGDFLNLADSHLAKNGLGPVVYTTLSDVTAVFPAQ